MTKRFVVIDVETTGNQPLHGDKIIQIGAVVIENNEITERFSSFVNPGRGIPTFVTQLTGITEEDVINAPDFSEIAPKILQLLDHAYFVAHNVPFDLSFIDEELTNSGYSNFSGPTIDTVELARVLLPTASGYKLSQLAQLFNIHHENPHQADSDAEVTGRLLLRLLDKLNSLPLVTCQRLQPLLKQFKSDIDPIIAEIIQYKLNHPYEDDDQYSVFNGIAYRNFSKEENTEVEYGEDFTSFKENITAANGQMEEKMSNYEVRSGQLQMMDLVYEAFENNSHSLIEAGTGTGKTLGYLLPATYYAKMKDKTIVISTHTVQLQQQIIENDIPMLSKVVPFTFKAAVLKGRQHYLCLRKFEQQLLDNYDDNLDNTLTKAMILIWLLETKTGDVEELNIPTKGNQFWYKVNSEGSTCLNRHCPWFGKCFYHRARRAAKEADLVITNHALLFSNTANDHQLLPSFNHAIIDEAHHLEDVVSDHFGISIDYFTISNQLGRLGYIDGQEMMGKLATSFNETSVKTMAERFPKFNETYKETIAAFDDLFTLIHQYVRKKLLTPKSEIGRLSFRYDVTKERSSSWAAILETADLSVSKLADALKLLRKIENHLQESESYLDAKQKGRLVDFSGLINTLETIEQSIRTLLLTHDENMVCWMEIDAKGARNATYLYAKPIDISELLADQFFAKKRSVILTSATLTISGKSFKYIVNRLGLEDFGPETNVIESPFSYETKAKLYIPNDIPNIKEVKLDEYIPILSRSLHKIAQKTKGRMLVLFTSYDMLRNTYIDLKTRLENEEFTLIAQGVSSGSRAKLTKNFKQNDQAILLGTSSFWEGVDIPGEDLSCIVIVRLPFSPPDNPVIAARSEKIKADGGNPFFDLSLPQAIIRFKQGFGRLIRTSSDKGAVFVFDTRIVTTRYGKNFIRSLPSVPTIQGPLDDLLENLQEWL